MQNPLVHSGILEGGVRLGCHIPLLDMGTHDVSNSLEQKWMQRPHEAYSKDQEKRHVEGGLFPGTVGFGSGFVLVDARQLPTWARHQYDVLE